MHNNPVWHPFALDANELLPTVTKASGIYLELTDGQKIMDCVSSWWVNIHGHCVRELIEALSNTAKNLDQVIYADFSHKPGLELAQNLLSLLPSNMAKIYYTDDGSTSIELALKLAFQYWVNKGKEFKSRFLAFRDGYHGDTVGAMSLGGSSVFTRKFSKLTFDVELVDYPRIYFNDTQIEAKDSIALDQIKQVLRARAHELAAVIIEPLVQGAGGMNMCSQTFLQGLTALCQEYDVLLIFDEVLTGFGRTGDYFACVKSAVQPDLICMSKGITGGMLPLAATGMTEEIFATFLTTQIDRRFFHGHSYTANPIACAVANTSIQLLQRNYQTFSQMDGLHKQFYQKYLANNEFIGNYRVCGTIAAFDLNSQLAQNYGNTISINLKKNLLKEGFLFRPLGNVVYIMTPYCIREIELELVYKVLNDKIRELF